VFESSVFNKYKLVYIATIDSTPILLYTLNSTMCVNLLILSLERLKAVKEEHV